MSRRLIITTGVLAAAIAISTLTIVNVRAQRISQGLPPAFGDLATVQNVEVADQSGQVLLKGTFSTKSDKPNEVERTAELTSPSGGTARGKAEIEIARDKGVVSKDEIELTAERLPASTGVKLLVDGKEAASFRTTDKGKVDLKLSRKASASQ